MAIKFNPLTGNFDFTGSGGGGASYIDGEVAVYADLSLSSSTAPLNSAWLVRTASGVWPVTRKQAGIYIRTATGGSNRDADYTYAGTLPDVFADSQFLLYDNTDTSKNLAFDLGSISTGATCTLTAPNASGTISITGHTHAAADVNSGTFDNARINWAAPSAIGSTTPAAGTFTTLTANNGTLTASAPVLDLAQTWNSSVPTYKTVVINVTNSGGSSTANNYPLEIQSAGTAVASFALDGRMRFSGILATGSGSSWATWISGTYNNNTSLNSPSFTIGAGGTGAGANGVVLATEGVSDVLSIRRTTNAQTFNIYNTYTSGTSYERGFLKWNANVLQLGTEKGSGGGSARSLALQTDGTTRLTIGSSGGFTLADAQDIAVGTTTGTKIGTATTQKIGFFNATPVVQQAAVADATDAASTQARLNDLLARLRTLGLIAT